MSVEEGFNRFVKEKFVIHTTREKIKEIRDTATKLPKKELKLK